MKINSAACSVYKYDRYSKVTAMKKYIYKLFLLFFLAGNALAQEQTFHFILSSGPGSGSDLSLEAYSTCFKKQNIKVIKEFKPGGDGIVAINALRQAPNINNNYSYVLMGNFGLNMLGKFPNIDLLEDINPLVYLNQVHLAVVSNKQKVSSINDLIKLSKSRPLNIGSSSPSGTYVVNKLFTELNLPYQVVPYKNSSSTLTDLLNGSIDAAIDTFVGAKQLVDAEKLQIITSSLDPVQANQYSHLNFSKHIPSFNTKYLGLILSVKPTTPADQRKILIDAVDVCHNDKELIQKLSSLGSAPITNITTEQIRSAVQSFSKK